jgi:hypothetical protein
MKQNEARLDRIDRELQFRHWLHCRRIFETMNAAELEAYAVTGIWVDRPEPAFGLSRLDSMNRESLMKLWKEQTADFVGRNGAHLEFYAIHGCWPD